MSGFLPMGGPNSDATRLRLERGLGGRKEGGPKNA